MIKTYKVLCLLCVLSLSACVPDENDLPLTPVPTDSPSPLPISSPNLITSTTVNIPQPNTLISSPLQIEGSAPIDWFLEDIVIAKLITSDGRVIALASLPSQNDSAIAQQSTFKGSMEFETPTDATEGFLVIEKSDETTLDEQTSTNSISIPIRFE